MKFYFGLRPSQGKSHSGLAVKRSVHQRLHDKEAATEMYRTWHICHVRYISVAASIVWNSLRSTLQHHIV